MRANRRAFTLIELLMVVAIISILAAIAMPNFMEAQVRAKVSRAKADVRTLATALETYCMENNAYPMCNNEMLDGWRPGGDAGTAARYLERLSTPVSYMAAPMLRDPFDPVGRFADFTPDSHHGTYTDQRADPDFPRIGDYKYGAIKMDAGIGGGFANVSPEKPVAWIVFSGGPDRAYAGPSTMMLSLDPPTVCAQFYDPTNGTASYGDIWRAGGQLQPGHGGWGAQFCRQIAVAR